jgi:double-stranded uracil-DNA glycosylase
MTERPGVVERPTRADLAAAADRSIPDVLGPALRVLFVGINPSLWSGATGYHFARPGNRFWRTLDGAGFTPRLLAPDESDQLLALGIGITNLVNRATARASELHDTEIRAGAARLRAAVVRWRPRSVAVLGISAYRTAFERPEAGPGRQPVELAGAPLWVLPNPSGLNAHYQLPRLVELYAEVRRSVEPDGSPARRPGDGR